MCMKYRRLRRIRESRRETRINKLAGIIARVVGVETKETNCFAIGGRKPLVDLYRG